MTTDASLGPNAPRALAAYLRLLAACLEDEAAVIEAGGARCEAVLRRFREGVLALSLQEAPLDALIAGSDDGPPAAIVVQGTPARAARQAPARRRR